MINLSAVEVKFVGEQQDGYLLRLIDARVVSMSIECGNSPGRVQGCTIEAECLVPAGIDVTGWTIRLAGGPGAILHGPITPASCRPMEFISSRLTPGGVEAEVVHFTLALTITLDPARANILLGAINAHEATAYNERRRYTI